MIFLHRFGHFEKGNLLILGLCLIWITLHWCLIVLGTKKPLVILTRFLVSRCPLYKIRVCCSALTLAWSQIICIMVLWVCSWGHAHNLYCFCLIAIYDRQRKGNYWKLSHTSLHSSHSQIRIALKSQRKENWNRNN